MTKVTKTGVRYLRAGSFISEEGRMHECPVIPPTSEWPTWAYGAQLYRWHEATVDGTHFKSKPEEVGPQHIIGVKKDLAAVEAEGMETCAWNMKTNGWPFVIECRQGHIAPPKDVVVLAPVTP